MAPKTHATLTHVEPLAGLLVLRDEPLSKSRAGIHAGQVQRHVVLLTRKRRIHERLAVIGVGLNRQRDLIGDHAPAHGLLESRGQICEDDISHRSNRLSSIRGEFAEVLINSRGVARNHDQRLGATDQKYSAAAISLSPWQNAKSGATKSRTT
jgi:hypothetical protein